MITIIASFRWKFPGSQNCSALPWSATHVWTGVCVFRFLYSKVNNHHQQKPLELVDVKRQIVLCASLCETVDFDCPIWALIVDRNPASDGGNDGELDNGVPPCVYHCTDGRRVRKAGVRVHSPGVLRRKSTSGEGVTAKLNCPVFLPRGNPAYKLGSSECISTASSPGLRLVCQVVSRKCVTSNWILFNLCARIK